MSYPIKPSGQYSLRDYDFAQADSKKIPMDEYLFKNGYKNAEESETESVPDAHSQNWLFDLLHRNLKYAIGTAEENKVLIEQNKNSILELDTKKSSKEELQAVRDSVVSVENSKMNKDFSNATSQPWGDRLKTDHSNDTKPYLKTSYVSGTSGYNIWSNGYCEQWGRSLFATGRTPVYITLLKTYRDNNYNVTGSVDYATFDGDVSYNEFGIRVGNTNTIIAFVGRLLNDWKGFHWRTCGYLASGQY